MRRRAQRGLGLLSVPVLALAPWLACCAGLFADEAVEPKPAEPVTSGQPADAAAPPEQKPGNGWGVLMTGFENGVDSIHGTVSRGISGIVRDFDRFFGEDRIDDDEEGTQIRLGVNAEFRENDQAAFNNYMSFRLELPQLEQRLKLIFEDVVEKNEDKDLVQEVRDSEPLTGLRYEIKENRVRYKADVGLRLSDNPDLFVRGRASREFSFDPWVVKPSQDVYWFLQDGFGARTQLRISRRLNSHLLFRSTSYARWEEDENGVTLVQAFSLYDRLSSRRVLRWNLAMEAPTEPETVVEKYWLTANYRQLVHSNWLYVEVTPGIEFPDDRDYKATPFIEFRLEMLLGEIAGLWTD